ncbi:MAG: hypothetical protein U5K51_04570 [Flavobacteriaceae bacterium]|nr:hypothetical protein [Flavobacteriaceae bacterium]
MPLLTLYSTPRLGSKYYGSASYRTGWLGVVLATVGTAGAVGTALIVTVRPLLLNRIVSYTSYS